MSFIGIGIVASLAIILAIWSKHTVVFMVAAGSTLLTACYMADIVSQGSTTILSVTYSLLMILLSFVFISFAFYTMFVKEKEHG